MHQHADGPHGHEEDDDLPLSGLSRRNEKPEDLELPMSLLAISVGNTNTRFTPFHLSHSHPGVSLPNANQVALVEALSKAAAHLDADGRTAVVFASTNHVVRDELTELLTPRVNHEVYRIGIDLDIPIEHALSDDAFEKTGQDRLLNALAAFDSLQEACVVVSAGTAITVDFIDGDGVFQGGAILPGLHAWLRAMHDSTSALPLVEPAKPEDVPFGRDTRQAMLQGAFYGIAGAVRHLVERYAEAFAAYPQVWATGGDAEALFGADEFINRIVPDLTLRGIALTCKEALTNP